MSATEWMILIAVIAFILSGLILLKDSAHRLRFTAEQLKKSHKRTAKPDEQEKPASDNRE